MNFKDAYKSYNDEIKGNPKILDAILNQEQKKKPVFLMRPIFACAMAAMFAVISVVGFNKFGNISSDHTKPARTYIAAKDISNNNESLKTDDNRENKEIIVAQNKTEIKNDVVKKSEGNVSGDYEKKRNSSASVANNKIQNSEKTNTNPDKLNNHPKKKNESSMQEYAEDVIANEPAEITQDPNLPMIARILPQEEAYSPEEVSYEEYSSYLGVDVLSDTKLPDDMKFVDEYTVNAQKNEETKEFVSGSVTASAISDVDTERTLSISVSKNEGEPAEKQYFYNQTSGEVIGAKSVSETVEIVVDSQKVTQTEIDTIIDSLQIN